MKYWWYRPTIAILIFLFFKITRNDTWSEFWDFDLIFFISFGYTFIVVLVLWEIISWFIKKESKKTSISSNNGLYLITTKASLVVIPLVLLFSYLYNALLGQIDCCEKHDNADQSFMLDFTQGFVISLLIIAYEIIILYVRNAINSAREREQIQKELAAAKLEGLKNQVNPHFLFNSFSVLTSLVEDDATAAVKFIAKLSDMYRYILENDEKTTVTLREELQFVDSYIFLLSMRHQSGLVVKKEIDLSENETLIPPMSIQILIENAVKHNSFSIDDPLHIIIKSDGNNSIVVENEKRKKEHLTESTQIGLKNLSNRLMLSVGKALEILDNDSTFQVRLPLLKI